ncbi:MAG: phosphate--AMP phosphotransferase [Lachnospiraceae bacterium]|nr:phosphate--AMP phosphotransferase [Lachnospiraceae bacterium]
MLEKIDLDKKLSKKEFGVVMDELAPRLSFLQRECRAAGIPIMIVFEGWGASGKGTLINKLIAPLDPRGFKVFTIQKVSEEEAMRPFLWRFWTRLPANGRIHIFDRSWYRSMITECLEGKKGDAEKGRALEDIIHYEQELSEDGMVIIKFFLHISQKEQKLRFKSLEKNDTTKWRVNKQDWKQNEEYDNYRILFDDMIAKTDTEYAPWTIIESTNKEYAASKIIATVVERLQEVIESTKSEKEELKTKELKKEGLKKEEAKTKESKTGIVTKEKEEHPDTNKENPSAVENKAFKAIEQSLKLDVLSGVDLSHTLDKEKYKKKLEELQNKLAILHYEMYQKRIPVVLAFEGWDAAGKGGAIKRLTENIDPRGYEVIPVAAPNDIERAHHYLWRFWNAIPKAGHLAVFDRTWYGRVLVERIEGFCSENEWKRSYNEINNMEEHLTNFGCIVLKFWLHIDQVEQEKRFLERQENPQKQWKITEEDWRNREKWDDYVEAVNEMVIRTSTTAAPWVIVEANDKYYARIKVLETVVRALEEKMGKV